MTDFIFTVGKFLMVILGFLSLGLGLWFVHQNDMEKQSKLISDNYEKGYLDACKDFYQGKLKYALVENTDGTREWKKINE